MNKVNSKVHLRWNPSLSPSLSEEQRQRILTRLANQITSDGDLLITSDRHRDQKMNRQDCLEKFTALIRGALVVPKRRKESKPSRSSVRKAKQKSKEHSQKKAQRGKVRF